MNLPLPSYPALESRHVAGARLFATRHDLTLGLARKCGRVAEVGVALGWGTQMLIDAFQPDEFVAFDLFRMHEAPFFWGKSGAEHFGGMTQLDYYRQKFGALPGMRLVTHEGDSASNLSRYPKESFDVIYIDGDHSFEGCKRDTEAALATIRPDGLLIFNDYVLIDTVDREVYGVVPIVNELVVRHGWYVVGFALHDLMYCDIALARRPAMNFYY